MHDDAFVDSQIWNELREINNRGEQQALNALAASTHAQLLATPRYREYLTQRAMRGTDWGKVLPLFLLSWFVFTMLVCAFGMWATGMHGNPLQALGEAVGLAVHFDVSMLLVLGTTLFFWRLCVWPILDA